MQYFVAVFQSLIFVQILTLSNLSYLCDPLMYPHFWTSFQGFKVRFLRNLDIPSTNRCLAAEENLALRNFFSFFLYPTKATSHDFIFKVMPENFHTDVAGTVRVLLAGGELYPGHTFSPLVLQVFMSVEQQNRFLNLQIHEASGCGAGSLSFPL